MKLGIAAAVLAGSAYCATAQAATFLTEWSSGNQSRHPTLNVGNVTDSDIKTGVNAGDLVFKFDFNGLDTTGTRPLNDAFIGKLLIDYAGFIGTESGWRIDSVAFTGGDGGPAIPRVGGGTNAGCSAFP